MRFGGRIIRQARSAFNRQIGESVEIQNNRHHFLLNSKSEYNRCALPRLAAKLGERTLDKMEKEVMEEKAKGRELARNIRDMKIKRGKERREPTRAADQPANKKRRINEYEHKD